MNITKHGEFNKENLKLETFKCDRCGCEFTADDEEYYIEKGDSFKSSNISVSTYSYSASVTDIYICSCPECHRIITKTKNRIVSNPCSITLSGTSAESSPWIPDPCKSCSNHPSNGGSGNCNCTLGTPPITCQIRKGELNECEEQ